jgi:aminoglycoside 3-N-acetyltransferase
MAVAAMLSRLLRLLPDGESKQRMKICANRARGKFTRTFFRYDVHRLLDALRRVGVAGGDTLLVHSALKLYSGFEGTPNDIIETLLQALGPTGTLLMVSMPFSGSMADYIRSKPVFDVLKTPSRMGILTEVFRRRRGVLRSTHPTHPILAAGAQAEWLVAGHESCSHPCGPGSPLDKLEALDGKVLFLDVPFNTFTFIHHIEHLVSASLPFPLYIDKPYTVSVIAPDRRVLTVDTYGFSEESRQLRNPHLLEQALDAQGVLHRTRVGNSKLMLVRAREALRVGMEMAASRPQFVFESAHSRTV